MEPMEAGPVEKARLRAMSFAVIGLTCACRVDAGRQRHLYWYSGWPRWPQMKDHSAAGVLSSCRCHARILHEAAKRHQVRSLLLPVVCKG